MKDPYNRNCLWRYIRMKKHGFAPSLVVGILLLLPSTVLAAREPKSSNPCRDLEVDLNDQINTLHRLQDRELAQCQQANGKNSDKCRDLKNQHALALRQMRDQRHAQLDICDPCHFAGFQSTCLQETTTIPGAINNSCRENSGARYPDKPYKHPPKNPPPVANHPPKHDGSGGERRSDGDAGDTRSAGNSGPSHHHSDHSSGLSSSSSGTSTRSNTSSGAGSSGSSSSGFSSSSSNSTSSSNSSPSSGSSFSTPSSAVQSSAPSHSNSGASHPK